MRRGAEVAELDLSPDEQQVGPRRLVRVMHLSYLRASGKQAPEARLAMVPGRLRAGFESSPRMLRVAAARQVQNMLYKARSSPEKG